MWDCLLCGCRAITASVPWCPQCRKDRAMPTATSGGASNAAATDPGESGYVAPEPVAAEPEPVAEPAPEPAAEAPAPAPVPQPEPPKPAAAPAPEPAPAAEPETPSEAPASE